MKLLNLSKIKKYALKLKVKNNKVSQPSQKYINYLKITEIYYTEKCDICGI